MYLTTKLAKSGHSLSIRLPKEAVVLSGLKLDQTLSLEIRPGRIIIRHPRQTAEHKLDQAYKDVKMVWDRALKDTWAEIFGPEDDE